MKNLLLIAGGAALLYLAFTGKATPLVRNLFGAR